MIILGFLFFSDLLASLSIRLAFLKEKPLGPITRLIYAFFFPKKINIPKSLFIKQFVVSISFFIYILLFLIFIFDNRKIDLIFMTPLLFLPFFSLLMSFFSSSHLNIISGLKQFRMKSVLNIIQVFCLIASTYLWPNILYIKILFFILGFSVLIFHHYIWLINQLPKNLIDISFHIEKSQGFSRIFYFWALILEIIYYLTLWCIVMLDDYKYFYLYILSAILFLSFISFLGIKNVIKLSYNFLETRILVSVLFLLGFISVFQMTNLI